MLTLTDKEIMNTITMYYVLTHRQTNDEQYSSKFYFTDKQKKY